jgi:hypothetical protein
MRDVLAVAGALVLPGLLLACNAILGINEASLAPADAGPEVQASANASYALDCDAYCSVIGANCQASSLGDDTEYLSAGVCRAMCAIFESTATEGGVVDPNTEPPPADTLNCRVWHANAAAHSPHTHCPHSGPLGANLCDDVAQGGACKAFCTLNVAFCTGDAAAYTSYGDCLNACLPDAGGYAGFPYQVSPTDREVRDLQTSGNTLNCRMYHLENFLFTNAAVHCSHTTPSGNGVCSSP